MKKAFVRPAKSSSRIELVFFCLALASGLNGEELDREQIIKAVEGEGIEIDDEVLTRIDKAFPGLKD